MKIAVITPYYQESEKELSRCMTSVLRQNVGKIIHVMVSDGYPQDFVKTLTKHHLEIPNCGDSGNTPRLIGAAYAYTQDVDGIILLDADCWLDEDHIKLMYEAHQVSGSPIITCPRKIWDKEGDNLLGHDQESNGMHFNDTNCYLIMKPAFRVMFAWGMIPQNHAYVGDRLVWDACKRSGANISRTSSTSVNYPSHHAFHYESFGLPVPKGSIRLVSDNGNFVRQKVEE